MEETIHASAEGNRTRAIPGSTEITAIFFDFKTGEQTNAGSDAQVELRIGGRRYVMPRQRGGHELFERGGIDVIGFPAGRFCTPPEPRFELEQLRKADILLAQDNSGTHPEWYVERISILVKLALPREPVLEFKHWVGIGWLDAMKPSVLLQRYECGHLAAQEGCSCCKRAFPRHPGPVCKCIDCATAYPRLLHA